MNILILFGGRYPSHGAASKRISNYKKGLELASNVVIIKSVYPVNTSKIRLFLSSIIIPFTAFLKIKNSTEFVDIVIVYGFGLFGKLVIIFASKLRGKRVVFEFNEYPYSISGSKRDKYLKYFNPIKRYCLNKFVIPHADGFVVISEALYEYISILKSNNAQIIKIPIIVDFNYYQRKVPQPDCHKPYILHSSTMNDNRDGISDVFNAVAEINSEPGVKIHFYLTSKLALSETWANVRQIIQDKNLNDYVHFLGDLDEQTLLAYQQHCSMVVLNKVDSLQNRYNFATKLGEYLSLGKPVITTLIGEAKKYLKNNENCLEIPPNRPDIISEKVQNLLSDPSLASKIGENGRNLAKDSFDIKVNGKKLSEFFTLVVEGMN